MDELISTRLPAEYVGADFAMMPGVDDLIRGDQLKNDMIVLIEDRCIREDGLKDLRKFDADYRRVCLAARDTTARWCVITDLHDTRTDIITFVGLYVDGTKRSRTYHKSYYWFVKI